MLNVYPARLIPVPAIQAWTSRRTLPPWRGGKFRKWWRAHQRRKTETGDRKG